MWQSPSVERNELIVSNRRISALPRTTNVLDATSPAASASHDNSPHFPAIAAQPWTLRKYEHGCGCRIKR